MNTTYKSNLFFFIVMILGIIGGFIIAPLPMKIADALSQYIFLFIPVLIYLFLTKTNIKNTLRLKKMKLKDIIIVVLIAIVMQPFIAFIDTIAINLFGNQVDILFSDIQNYSFMFMFFTIAITPAICEELVLRGVILDGYRGMNIKKAAIMNGFLFGIFHMNIHQFSYAFFMGILLAYVVYITDSIYSSMIIHFINNGLAVILIKFGNISSASADKIVQNNWYSELTGIITAALISLILIILLVKSLIKSNNKDMNEIDNSIQEQKFVKWPIAISTILFLITSALITMAQYVDKAM